MQTVQWETEIKSKNLRRKVDRDEETGEPQYPFQRLLGLSLCLPWIQVRHCRVG